MSVDIQKLKHLALAQPEKVWRRVEGEPSMMTGERMFYIDGAGGVSCWEHGARDRVSAAYIEAACPAAVLELIAEIDRLERLFNQANKAIDRVHAMYKKAWLEKIGQPYPNYGGFPDRLENAQAEIDQLKAEVEIFRKDAQDALAGQMHLHCHRDLLKAENEELRNALAECVDSLHAEMLQKFGGQRPDDMHPVTRREYDRDMAEIACYRELLNKESRP